LLVSTFIGDVQLDQGLWYEEVTRRAISHEVKHGRKVANVHDASRSTGSSPEMRKFWADLGKRNAATMETRTLVNFIVVSSPVVRGVLTAVGWLNPQVARLRTFSTLQLAVGEAIVLLERAGTKVTLPLGGYRLPTNSSLIPPSR
jgi:hypothetical protein